MIARLKDIWTSFIKKHKGFFEKYLVDDIKRFLVQAGATVLLAYFAATIFSSLLVPLIMKSVVADKGREALSNTSEEMAQISPFSRPNFRDIRKAIMDRNVFNSDGEFPDEKEESAESEQNTSAVFDENAPCFPSKLNLTLVGTIYLGTDSKISMATILEQGMDESDIYKVGDTIIGHEDVHIVDIFRNRVVLNNAGKKECIEIAGAVASFSKETKKDSKKTTTEENTGPVVLQSSWVESQLGEGFSKIIADVRLVPNTTAEGSINGFKIFKIPKGSLMDKVGFKDGDVITKVNESVLNEQAFVLYDAFLNEKDITIQLLRNGKTPTVINVQIK